MAMKGLNLDRVSVGDKTHQVFSNCSGMIFNSLVLTAWTALAAMSSQRTYLKVE